MVKITLIFSQNLVTAINILNCSALVDSVTKKYKTDYLSSALIPAEAVYNDQKHLAAIRY